MVMPTAARKTATQVPPFPVDRFSVDQYHRMIEKGIWTAKDRVELLEGWIVKKMALNPPHNIAITRINRRLLRLLPEEWLLQVQGAITLSGSEPEPDFAIIRGPERVYSHRKARPRDIALVIEVADSLLLQELVLKGRLCAAARIPEDWIIYLVAARVEVFTPPKAGKSPGCRQQRNYGLEEAVPLAPQGRLIDQIPARELLAGVMREAKIP